MADRFRWGILGTGMIARKFADQLSQSHTGELAAVGSRSEKTAAGFCNQFGGTPIVGYDAALEEEFDGLYISLPNAMHCQWTLRALAAGKHVLCEKPLASSRDEAARMFAAAEEADRTLVEAFMYRCHPAVQKLIEMARAGAVGELKLIRSSFTFNRAASADDCRYQADLAGGSLMDVGCYCVNLARAIAGRPPRGVHAIAHRHALGVDDYAAAVLDFGDGLLAAFTCGMTVTGDRTTFIEGDRGYLAIDTPWFTDGRFQVFTGDDPAAASDETIETLDDRGHYAIEADTFAAVVRDGAEPPLSEAETLDNMGTLDELRRAAGWL